MMLVACMRTISARSFRWPAFTLLAILVLIMASASRTGAKHRALADPQSRSCPAPPHLLVCGHDRLVATSPRVGEAILIRKGQIVGGALPLIPFVISHSLPPEGAVRRALRPRVRRSHARRSPEHHWRLCRHSPVGLHMAFSQGHLSALVADTAPADLKGTAFGLNGRASWQRQALGAISPRSARRICNVRTAVLALQPRKRSQSRTDLGAQRPRQSYPISTGKPAAFHSGNPSSSRRALKPILRNCATASKERTQYGPRQ
jgi:hypothetical protein